VLSDHGGTGGGRKVVCLACVYLFKVSLILYLTNDKYVFEALCNVLIHDFWGMIIC
jgi:hypothetical protein